MRRDTRATATRAHGVASPCTYTTLNHAARVLTFGLARYRAGARVTDFEVELEVNLRDGTARALWWEGVPPLGTEDMARYNMRSTPH